jgi:uncharacterized protein (TIGR02271 family)
MNLTSIGPQELWNNMVRSMWRRRVRPHRVRRDRRAAVPRTGTSGRTYGDYESSHANGWRRALQRQKLGTDERKTLNPMDDEIVIPVVREELKADTQKVKAGTIRVQEKIHEDKETIEQALVTECVDVERIAKNEMVSGPQPIRGDGDALIIPVVKEVLRVERGWILTEEVRMTR